LAAKSMFKMHVASQFGTGFRRVSGVFALFATTLVSSAAAQLTDVTPTSSGRPITVTPSIHTDRDAEYAAIARDVERFGRELDLVKRVVKLITPAVVHIESNPLMRQGSLRVEEAGSGVIVQFGPRYYVLTNRHVIRHSSEERIEIHLADGRVFNPKQIWSDRETDVAVMAIESATGLAAARLGDSDALEIGDFVLAVGSPFGLSQSVTRGIVSAKGRHNLNLGDEDLKWQNFIQTDAAINPGNSGGPLVNLRGEIVGLNTAIASASGGNEGIGFSIPVNIVSRMARALVENREVPRGFLGVDLDRHFNQQRAAAVGLGRLVGTRVTRVRPQSPAEKADLRVNDVILEFNGVRIEQDMHLISLVKLAEVGRQVELLVLRDGKLMRVRAEIGDAGSIIRADDEQ
jgi:serine protease Do